MSIQHLLNLDRTLCAVSCQSKKRILETISKVAAEALDDISHNEVLASLVHREKMGSTGIGHGIAIPHGRLPNIDDVIAVMVTTSPGVDFDAIDNEPVDIFFALLVPEAQIEGHLQTLAEIAAKLNDPTVVKKLRGAQIPQEMLDAFA
jgi:PTS system nitrogen regulatory IIA component